MPIRLVFVVAIYKLCMVNNMMKCIPLQNNRNQFECLSTKSKLRDSL